MKNRYMNAFMEISFLYYHTIVVIIVIIVLMDIEMLMILKM